MSKKFLSVLLVAFGFLGLLSTVVLAGLPEEPLQALDCSKPVAGFACATKTGGGYTYDSIAAPSTLNPVTASDTASDAIADHIFGSFFTSYSLLGQGAQGTDPAAASVIEVSKDGTTVTYTLRKGLVYSDGSPVTADDIFYWYYNVVWNPNLPNSQTSVVCADGSPFKVTSPAPNQIQVSCPATFRTLTSNAVQFVMSKQMALDLIKAQNIATQPAILPGPDGVLETTPVSVKVITAGPDGTLESKPAGDDVAVDISGNTDNNGNPINDTIEPGPDGVLETTPAGDDQVTSMPIDIVSGPIIAPALDGILHTTAVSGDDVLVKDALATQEFLGLGVDIKLLRGLGPFVLTNFNSSAVANYQRNPNFYEADSNGTQLPYVDKLTLIIIPTAGLNLSLTNFLNGTTDYYAPRPGDIAPVLSQAAAGGFKVNQDIDQGNSNSGEVFVTPNFEDKDPNLAAAARNVQVRHAMDLAIDRLSIVQNVLLGIGTPQYNEVSITENNFFSGRKNTCDAFTAAGLADAAHPCANGKWTVAQGLALNVTRLPDVTDANVKLELQCLVGFDVIAPGSDLKLETTPAGDDVVENIQVLGITIPLIFPGPDGKLESTPPSGSDDTVESVCIGIANALLDAAGLKKGSDGVRVIPANFDKVVGNPGGPFVTQIVTNTGNTIREESSKIVCDGWSKIGIKCAATTTSFPTLVNQLLTGTFTGNILIGLTGGDPAGAVNVVPCGQPLHLWHVACDPKATSGVHAATDDEKALTAAFNEGYAAKDVPSAQKGFDAEQAAWAQYVPYFELSVQNLLYAQRIDRIANTGRAVNANDDVKFRCDLQGQSPNCAAANPSK